MIPQKKKDKNGNVPARTGPFKQGDKVLCLWVGKKSIPLEYYGCTVCRYPPHPILFLHFIFDFNGTKSWLCKRLNGTFVTQFVNYLQNNMCVVSCVGDKHDCENNTLSHSFVSQTFCVRCISSYFIF